MIQVERTYRRWIKRHRNATLDDLKRYLEGVLDEVLTFDPEATIADYQDELSEDALEYLSDWGDLACGVMANDEPATFEYREGNLEDDILEVEEAIEKFGGSCRLRPRQRAAAPGNARGLAGG
jgi:hypothetical protein